MNKPILSPFIIVAALASHAIASSNSPSLPSPLELDSACKLAIVHNHSIRQASQTLLAQDGTVLSQRAAGLPQVGIAATYNVIDEGRIESFGPDSQFNDQTWMADLELRQSLFSGGRLHYTLQAQEHVSAGLVYALQDTALAVTRDTTERFHAVLLARARIAVFEDSVHLLSNELALASNRFAAGVGQAFDTLRADVALRNERPLLLRAQNDYTAAVDALLYVMGLSRSALASGEIALTEPVEAAPSDLPVNMGSSRRPSLLAAEENVHAEEAALTVARLGTMPSLNAVAAYGAQNLQFDDEWTDTLEGWKAGLQLDWPLFDSALTRGEIRAAQASLEKARIVHEATEIAVDMELRQAIDTLRTAGLILEAADGVIAQAEEALRMARSRHSAGAGTQQEILDAQVGLSRARLQKASARYDHGVALARYHYVMGTATDVAP